MRLWLLLASLVGLSWFQFVQISSAASIAQRALDLADARPARSILILGNSRTFYNDMPGMLRQIADSAGSHAKFQIESYSRPGYALKDHWSDRRTQRLLGSQWDEIIIQGESSAQSAHETAELFKTYGARLAPLARPRSGQPTLVVAWPYDPSLYADFPAYRRAEHLRFLRSVHADLARTADLKRVHLDGLWESVRRTHPEIKLTSDGNHPTVEGTYLYALAMYRHLSKSSVLAVNFVPDGVSPAEADALRRAVELFPVLTG